MCSGIDTRKRPGVLTAVVSLGLICLVGVGCGSSEFMKKLEEKKAELEKQLEEPRIVIPVEAQQPHRDDISAYFETTTRVEAEDRVDIMSQGVGDCLELLVEEGDKVRKGQILAELEKDEARASLNQNEVQVRKQQNDYLRAKNMYEEGLVSKAEYDNARFTYEQGLAGLKMQREQYDDLTVRSPIDGIVTNRNVQVGQLVTSGTPLFSVVDPNSYILVINPPEKEIYRLEVGQIAEVSVDSVRDSSFRAKVRRINPAIDVQSGTIKVCLDVEESAREQLREAAFARVRLIMETHESALLVPKDAVVEENARKYLFLVEEAPDKDDESENGEDSEAEASDAEDSESAEDADDAEDGEDAEGREDPEDDEGAEGEETKLIAKRVEVETGLESSDFVEIMSGIDDDSLIITLGQQTLKPGSEIKVTTAEQELAAKRGLPAEEALEKAEEKRQADSGKRKAGRGRPGRKM